MAGTAQTYTTSVPITSGASFANLQSGGIKGVIDAILAANPAIANPTTAPTMTATGGGGSGGTLPAGAYYTAYAWNNGFGRTAAIESVSTVTITLGQIPRVTIPALPTGCVSAYIYVTAAGGASGTTKYYKATTGTTADLTIAAFEDDTVSAPTTNTTAATTYAKYANVYANMTRMPDLLTAYQATLDDFLRGDPVNQNELLVRLQTLTACLAAVYKAVDNATALVFANTGTLAFDSSAKYGPNGQIRRTFP